MSSDIDPSDLSTPGYESAMPSPAPTDGERQANKRKRKAWGQPIPEFKEVIGPRKRAKTAEEKEQRKNERILRNRRAADKSRQRQKAAVVELEAKQIRMEQENAALRSVLAQYQSKFGSLPGFSFPTDAPCQPLDPHPSTNLDVQLAPESKYNPLTPLSFDGNSVSQTTPRTPALSYGSPMTLSTNHSPSLAPTLFPSQDQASTETEHYDDLAALVNFDETGMTQYPAAILCDLQCQPLSKKFRAFQVSHKFNLNLQLLHLMTILTVYKTYSTTMLSLMAGIFHTLVKTLSTPSMDQEFLANHFHLIHTLISTPTSTTEPAGVFRMKLLSRLLACSPRMARLLMAATDRALQRVVSEEDFASNSQARWMWASLLTMKWSIIRLEKEHQRHRQLGSTGSRRSFKMDGVDYLAVERNSWRWRSTQSMSGHRMMDDICADAPQVH